VVANSREVLHGAQLERENKTSWRSCVALSSLGLYWED